MLAIKLYMLAWFFTSFEPLQKLIDKLAAWFFTRFKPNDLTDGIYIALGCQKCMTFWSILLATGNIWWAIVGAIIAELHKKYTK